MTWLSAITCWTASRLRMLFLQFTATAVSSAKQLFEILEQRLEDMNELLDLNIDKIAEEAQKGRE